MKTITTECCADRISRAASWLACRLLIPLFVIAAAAGQVCADDENFTNDTMETRIASPPPNIMFVLDNSGSMDWSFMVPENNGQFAGASYLWELQDNAYKRGEVNGDISKPEEWQGQWSVYNRIYYNPVVSYEPWPRWNKADNTEGPDGKKIIDGGDYPPFNADLETPRSNPILRTPTLNLHAKYADLPAGKKKTVEVRNAHYYMVHDKNGDGRLQNDDGTVQRDDEVYLVNFVWTDSNGNDHLVWTDSDRVIHIDKNEVTRHYYLVSYNDDSKNHEDVTALTEVKYDPDDPGSDDVPDAIQPRTYDNDGNPDGFVSDIADLQNFANWFSFYRRRELTAKAAVARTLVDMDNAYVGFNTLWRNISNTVRNKGRDEDENRTGGGAKQAVLPVNIQQESGDIIIDNQDAGSEHFNPHVKAKWEEDSETPEWKGSSISTDQIQWAKFTPQIDEKGLYEIAAWWNCSDDRDQKARITIKHGLGKEIEEYNQRAAVSGTVTESDDCTDPEGSGCCGYWVDLGTYYLGRGSTNFVQITRHRRSTGASTVADAVRFRMKGRVDSGKFDLTNELLDVLYRVHSDGDTPLRRALQDVGQYYHMDDKDDGGIGDCPYLPADQGGACQHAYAIAMTDGFWNGGSPKVGNADGEKSLYSGILPYADDYSNTLADVAMRYYDTDLAASLLDEMPTNNYDKNKRQHMVTFSVSFGLDGTISLADIGYDDDPYFLEDETKKLLPGWPEPEQNEPSTIDDLLHASVNGRGRFFSAKDPDSLVSALKDTFADIVSRKASGASVSVNGDELSTGLILYQSSYTSGDWTGDVAAYPIDPSSGVIDREHSKWEAQDKVEMQDWDTGRNIFTLTVNDMTKEIQGVPFRYKNLLSSAQQEIMESSTGEASDLVDYLRGKKVTGFREREKILGDLVHSAPLLVSTANPESDGIDNDEDGLVDEGEIMNYAYLSDGINNDNDKDADGNELIDEDDEKHNGIDDDGDGIIDEEEPQETGGTLFVGGNDGMLHAFNAETGTERFAYVPLRSFDYLDALAEPDYEHRYYVDGRQSFERLKFLAGNQTEDGIDNDGDGCTDGEECPAGVSEADNGDNEDYSDKEDNDGDGETDESGEYKTITLLVGTLNKGGRGIYALDVSTAESTFADSGEADTAKKMVMWEYPPVGTDGIEYAFSGDQRNDGVDNDGDGYIDDDPKENDNGDNENYSDGFDNDGDGIIDEAGEMVLANIVSGKTIMPDDDMGYTYGDAFIARSYKSRNETYKEDDHPWIVVFANGYQSKNGVAVLYVVDALTGKLIRKISTGAGGNNGLSSPTLVDVDNDDRVDFVYAGDLNGNMWKFDLRNPNPDNWGVFYGKDNSDDGRIDYNDVNSAEEHDLPKPLIKVGRPITSAPDVAFHCEKEGYIVVFGTGKFLGANDVGDNSQQGLFGIWDFGDEPEDYLGDWAWDDAQKEYVLTDIGSGLGKDPKPTLLEQTEIAWDTSLGYGIRIMTNSEPQWYDPDSGEGNVGWFFDLPYDLGRDGRDNDGDGEIDEDDEDATLAGERVVKDVMIRSGNAIVISLIPGDSPCDGGGKSIVHALDFCRGGRQDEIIIDINHDGKIDEKDMVDIDGKSYPASGILYDGILHAPVVVDDPDKLTDRELNIFSSSAGVTEGLWTKEEKKGFYYWKEY
ncbi:MAG: PilC/PilY family type IV pilus protein [Candidatus Electrothrix sp. YB6]